MINNRQQSGRRRGRGGQRQNNNTGGGGRGPESGNRIDNRARGNAAQMLEKYKALARDTQQAGDRVLTEYYLQFADHYFRVLSETRARYEENNPGRARQEGASNEDSGFEGDEGDEGGEDEDFGFRAPPRAQHQPQPHQQRDARPREDRPRDDRPREDRLREDRPREDRQAREDRPQREDRPRDDRPRDDRPRRDYGEDRGNRAVQPSEAREEASGNEARQARRPLRAQPNGHDDHADDARLDMSVLPPALSVSMPSTIDDEDAPPAPRRRGRPKKDAADAPVEN